MAVCATAAAAAEVAPALRAPGLLDRALTLRAPGPGERAALLASALSSRGVTYDPDHVQASPCPMCRQWRLKLQRWMACLCMP